MGGQGVADSAVARRKKLGVYILAAALVSLVAGGLYLRSRSAQPVASPLSEKDTIVLADFTNSTGDPVFDGTLKQALAVDLEQSPFLNILSDTKASETLKLMGRTPSERITAEVATNLPPHRQPSRGFRFDHQPRQPICRRARCHCLQQRR